MNLKDAMSIFQINDTKYNWNWFNIKKKHWVFREITPEKFTPFFLLHEFLLLHYHKVVHRIDYKFPQQKI